MKIETSFVEEIQRYVSEALKRCLLFDPEVSFLVNDTEVTTLDVRKDLITRISHAGRLVNGIAKESTHADAHKIGSPTNTEC